MLLLIFRVRSERYGLDSANVVETIPLVKLTPGLADADYLAGFCRYRGLALPVIDLSLLLVGQPCAQILSTRIMIVSQPQQPLGEGTMLCGLMAEQLTEARNCRPEEVRSLGSGGQRIVADEMGPIRILPLESIFTPEVCRHLQKAMSAS